MENLEKTLDECREASAQIEACRNRITEEKNTLGREIERMKAELPLVLANVELGEAKATELTQIKSRIVESEERLTDIDLALVGLQKRSDEVSRHSTQASNELLRLKGLEEYEAVKKKVRAFERADQLDMRMKIEIQQAAGSALLGEDGNKFIAAQERRLEEADRKRALGRL